MTSKTMPVVDEQATVPVRLQKMRVTISEALIRRNTHQEKIPSDELVIVGGAALQMYGIKKTDDIDVVVTPQRMEQVLEERFRWVRGYEQGYNRELGRRGVQITAKGPKEGQLIHPSEYGSTYGDITYMVAPNDHLYQASFEELLDEAVRINGFFVSPPERILEWKRSVNRPKDTIDIRRIERYLANQ